MLFKDGDDSLLRLGVDLAGRLVGNENGRLGSERYSETSPRRFAARKVRGIGVTARGYSDEFENFGDARLIVLSGEVHLEPHILPHGEMIEQVPALEQDSDQARAQTGAGFLITPCETLAVDVDEAAVRLVEPGDARHESRLPTAGRTHDRDDLAAVHLHAHAAQRLRLVVADVVEAVQLARFDRWRD